MASNLEKVESFVKKYKILKSDLKKFRRFLRALIHSLMGKVCVVGDSHCNFFSGKEHIHFRRIKKGSCINNCNDKLRDFTTFHLGPAIAYNLNKFGTKTQAREKIEWLIKHKIIRKNTKILFTFGEIDCRHHVYKNAWKENCDYRVVVDKVVSNYIEFLADLKSRGYKNIWVWGAIATKKDIYSTHPDFPYTGTEVERNKATAYFNEILKEKCCANGIGFISIFNNLIDENYETIDEYISADTCHLSQRAWSCAKLALDKSGILK